MLASATTRGFPLAPVPPDRRDGRLPLPRGQATFEQDRRQEAHLVAAGYEVLRFTWHQLIDEPTEGSRQRPRPPHPHPHPASTRRGRLGRRPPAPAAPALALLQRLLHLLGAEELQDVAHLDVGVAVEHDAALEALLDLLDVVLEAAQRADAAGPDDGALADQADLGIVGDLALLDDRSRRCCRRARRGRSAAPRPRRCVSSTSSGSSMPSSAARRSSVTL